jgi:hypothetical protein
VSNCRIPGDKKFGLHSFYDALSPASTVHSSRLFTVLMTVQTRHWCWCLQTILYIRNRFCLHHPAHLSGSSHYSDALSAGGDGAILKKVLLLFYSKLYQLMKMHTHTHTHIHCLWCYLKQKGVKQFLLKRNPYWKVSNSYDRYQKSYTEAVEPWHVPAPI